MYRLLTLLPALIEMIGIIAVDQWIGTGWTFLALLAGAVLGFGVIRFLGAASWKNLQDAMLRRESPGPALLRGAAVLVAGFLLLLPGFISDFLGLILLLPGASEPAGRWLWGKLVGSATPLRPVWADAEWRESNRKERGFTLDGDFSVERNDNPATDGLPNPTTHRHDPAAPDPTPFAAHLSSDRTVESGTNLKKDLGTNPKRRSEKGP